MAVHQAWLSSIAHHTAIGGPPASRVTNLAGHNT
jgi:hypothetical protein